MKRYVHDSNPIERINDALNASRQIMSERAKAEREQREREKREAEKDQK